MLSSAYIDKVRQWLRDKEHASDVDEMLLEQLSDAIDLYNDFNAVIREEGCLTEYNSGKALHPAYKGMEATAKRIIMLSDKLGLSPRARKGIAIEAQADDTAPSVLDEFV